MDFYQIDIDIFLAINKSLSSDLLDAILIPAREAKNWIPLYAILCAFMIYKFKWKGLIWVLSIAVTTGVADMTSSHLIKKNVKRLRPCRTADLDTVMVKRIHCGSGYSFTSSHATNHMAIASFIICTLLMSKRIWALLIVAWAVLIGFAQIYVGVHFPSDVLAGFCLGFMIGYVFSNLYGRLKWAIGKKEFPRA